MEWSITKICDLYEIGSGISITPDKYGYGYPFLTFKDIFNSPYIKDEIETLVDSSAKDRKNSSIKKGDVFLTRTSETAEELGMSTVALKDYPEATFNGFSKRLRPISDIIVPLYAAYFFRSPYFRAQASSMSSIITRASLNNTNISHFNIKYPSKADQIRIGSILYSYDTLIENNQKRIKLLEQMAENIYKEWFIRFRFPGYETAEFEGGVVPKGWISKAGDARKPQGWTYGELNQLGTFIRGKNITSAEMIDGHVPVISAGLEPSGYHNQANVDGPCLTISSSGANAGYLKYNLTDIWAADCSYYNNPNNLWFVYSSLKYLQSVISNLQCGSAQPHVYPKDVNRLCIVLPPNSLVEEYTKQCNLIFEDIHNLNSQISLLTTQRDLLLPRLMSSY